jgi:UDP-glucose 4-epimerase
VKVLVTGADGFIGSRLVSVLAEVGHEVTALGRDVDLSLPLDRDALPAVDAIVHLAQANVPFPEGALDLYRVNTVSTAELLELARECGAGHFVYASSGSVYGFGDGAVAEDDPRRASDFYAVTKRNAEALVEAYAPFLSTVILRPFTPYGPWQRGRLVPGLVARVRDGRPVTLNERGRPRLTPVYLDDVLRVLAAAVELEGHHVVNLAGDEVTDIRGLAGLIGEALGREPVFEQGPGRSGDLIADNGRLHELFAPGPLVSLAAGVRRTVLAEVVA